MVGTQKRIDDFPYKSVARGESRPVTNNQIQLTSPEFRVRVSFMSAAAAPDDTPTPGRFGCAIGLVRNLIEFARELAAAFQQPTIPSPATAATRFGADGIAQILARIARALLRAQVLQERLHRLAARPEPRPRPQQTPTPPSQRAPRSAAPSVVAAAPDVDQPPTAESIAAEDRRRPIGVVFADI
jgi:hypothetical protein